LSRCGAIGLAVGLLLTTGCNRAELITQEIGLGEVPPQERRDLYLRLCASCHGRDGRGDGPCADALRVRPPDLTRLAAVHGGIFPRDDVEATLNGERPLRAHGPAEMPIWGQRLAEPEESPAATAVAFEQARLMTALIDYVESLQH
jgi:mono/diheme cytochrome c family protein